MCGVNGDEIYLPYNLSFYILYIYVSIWFKILMDIIVLNYTCVADGSAFNIYIC